MENNNQNQNRVSTSGITLFDENSMMLRMGYLDDSLSLVLGECEEVNGKRSFPQEKRHSFIITLDRAEAFYNEIIIKKVLKAIENGEDYNGGIFLNKRKDSIVEIRVQQGEIYLVYYKEIGEDRKPKDTYTFKFNKTDVVELYNPDGTSFEQSKVEGCFMIFCKYLESGIYDLGNSSAHAMRKANQYTTSAIFNYLKMIAAKLGVTVENSNSGFNRSSNPGFASVPAGMKEDVPFVPEIVPTETSLEGILS